MKDMYNNVKGALEGIIKPTSSATSSSSISSSRDAYSSLGDSSPQQSDVSRPSNTIWGFMSSSDSNTNNQGLMRFFASSVMSK